MSSFFWRNPHQQQVVLGLFRVLHKPDQTQRILDVGCSSGEMVLTYAISLREEYGEDWHKHFAFTAIDNRPIAIEQCTRGIYPGNRIYQTPRHMRLRYFDEVIATSAAYGRVSENSKSQTLLMFKRATLQQQITWICQDFDEFDDPGPFAMVFCQNTLLHLPDKQAERFLHKLHDLLSPGGFLLCAGRHAGSYKTLYELGYCPVPCDIRRVYGGWVQRQRCSNDKQRLKDYDPDDPLLEFKIGSVFQKGDKPREPLAEEKEQDDGRSDSAPA